MILEEDFQNIVENYSNISTLYNKTILVTGATGFIGSLLVRFFLYLNKNENANIHIIGVIRSKRKVQSLYQSDDIENIELIKMDLARPHKKLPPNIDYIIHSAAITSSVSMQTNPVDVINLTINSTRYFLEYTRRFLTTRMIYISSMEIYGSINKGREYIKENDLGYIDLLAPRSSYPESKRMAETLCSAYVNQYNCKITIARLAQTFGAGILSDERRVFYQFAKSIINNRDVELKTPGTSEGNYVYAADALAGIFQIMLKGIAGEAYNVVNEVTHTTIKDMAKQLVYTFGDGKSNVVFNIPDDFSKLGYMDGIRLKLSSEKLVNLGWVPTRDLMESYFRMMEYMKEKNL